MNESELSQRLTAELRKHKCIIFKIHGHTMQQPGIPDFYIASNRFSGWIETKGSNTLITPLQRIVIGQLKSKGVPCFVLRFNTDRHFMFEDEETNMLANFSFTKWSECAEKFLLILHRLGEEFACGFRASQSMSHSP